MSIFSLGPRDGYCMLDFRYIWLLQAMRNRDEDAAYRHARYLAAALRSLYPHLKEGA